jgi:hypothetical protein
MFLRIENDHSIVWNADYTGEGNWCLEQVPPELQHRSCVITPVVLNPCLEPVRGPRCTASNVFFDGGEELAVRSRHTFTLQQFEHQSIGQGFFSVLDAKPSRSNSPSRSGPLALLLYMRESTARPL